MPETTYPTGPVPATVTRWARMARVFAPPHILGPSVNNAYGATVSGLNLTIGRGTAGVAEAWVRSFFHVHDAADRVFTVPANAHATQARIDRVVLRWDPATETATLTHLQGTPAATPVAAPITQDDLGVWDLPLWRFTVPANNGAPLTALGDERRFIDPATGGTGLTVYSTANVQNGATAASIGTLSVGLWEIEAAGDATAASVLNNIAYTTANGLTTAAAASTPNSATGSGAASFQAVSGTWVAGQYTAVATTANGQAAVVLMVSNGGTAVGPFRHRMVLRVLTPGTLNAVAQSSGAGYIMGGTRFTAVQIGT